MKKIFLLVLICLFTQATYAQSEQEFETDTIILNRIEKWKDLKFGFMMHWGIYSQWGVVESWSICNEPWITRNGENYVDYVKRYQDLNKTFNPTKFNPEYWAEVANKAGMKYVVFTTKHHDGFSMFDTKETSYSITDKSCPYSLNPKADITAEVVKEFRKKNFWIGLYFSKPDWHCKDYWAPEWATPDRNVNYDIDKYPERWKKYCDFTFNQIKELTTNYGNIDILWLDGGWVRPQWSLNEESESWLGCYKRIQDINMPKIASMARENNSDLLIVDRSVHGKYENYRTPEQEVPDKPLNYPWETCMTMGDSWSYVPNDNYKSTNKLIHLLVDIVSKGGNFLLNVAPDANGELPIAAIERMKEIGSWLDINGEAIYETRPISPYKDNNLCFTQNKIGKIYGIYLLDEGNNLPEYIEFNFPNEIKTGNIKIKGTNIKAKLIKQVKGYKIIIPKKLKENQPSQHAVVFCL
ncbi:hypothetical protein SDC9_45119 [bioreactor metagenome]|uniref:alpha-L-fucosidase n=1 Tax=bioreactor metagenome TaxID=1076179 RepID=A0A644W5P9_9ZZZZ